MAQNINLIKCFGSYPPQKLKILHKILVSISINFKEAILVTV